MLRTVMPASSAYFTAAGADDQLQVAALGGVDLRLLDLGGGADDDGVKITQSGAQLIGLIELLNDLVTVLAQLCHCAGFHTVSNQNSLNRHI